MGFFFAGETNRAKQEYVKIEHSLMFHSWMQQTTFISISCSECQIFTAEAATEQNNSMTTFRQKGHSSTDSITAKTAARKVKNKSMTMKITSIMWQRRLRLNENKDTLGSSARLYGEADSRHWERSKWFSCPRCRADTPPITSAQLQVQHIHSVARFI